jgi:AcrR family transcriptional regulator
MELISLRKGEATRARIIEAAYSLFMEQGYHGTSMRQIVDRAGSTIGGIYAHFAGKESIWEAVFLAKHPYQEILGLLHNATGDTVEQYISQVANRLVNGLGHRENLLSLLFIELVEFKGKHIPEIYLQVLPQLIHLGQVFSTKQGKLRPFPLPILARSFAGFFFSYFITEIIMPPQIRSQMGSSALDDFVDIYLHGILVESAVKSND